MNKTALVIEVGTDKLRIVEVANRSNGLELVRFAIRNLPPDGLSAEWLRRVWLQEHFTRSKAYFLLPPSEVSFKTVMLPVLPPKQMEAAVNLELNNRSNRKELVSIIGCQSREQLNQIRAAVVNNEYLEQIIQIFNAAGVKIEWSGVKSRGIENFISFNKAFLDEDSSITGYIDLTDKLTEFGVYRQGENIYHRSFPPGSLELWDAGDFNNDNGKEILADFLEELRLSISSYRATTENGKFQKLWAFGDIENLSGLLEKITAELNIQTYHPTRASLFGVLPGKNIPQLAPLIGLALEATGLIERDYGRIYTETQQKAVTNRKKLMNIVGLIGAVMLAATGVFFCMQAGVEKEARVNQWLSSRNTQLLKLKYLERNNQTNLQKIQRYETWLGLRGRELEFLRILQENLPNGTRITDLTIENGTVKDLAGVTPSVTLLLSKIKDMPGLRDLKLKGTITTSAAGEVFHLEGSLENIAPPSNSANNRGNH